MSEDAELEILDWLLDPPKAAPMLLLRGSPGVGKSALLTSLHHDLPDSLLLDCRGLTAEEVLDRLLIHFGLKVRHRPLRDPLEDALAGMRTGGIVLLANVQWSGRLFSSPDEAYDIQRVAAQFSRRGQGNVLPVLELCGPSGSARADGADEIVLEAEVEGPGPAALLMEHPALRALAAAELREIPLHVWAFLDTALGGRRTEDDLRRSGQELSAVLRLEPDADGATVRLSTDALKHLLREAAPLTRAEQQSMADALLAEARRTAEGTADARITAYANRALAVHAALSGTLPQLIDDEPALAAFADRVSLQQAIRLAWPEGPPLGGVAGDAHYLDGDGVTPDSQSEWLAWLHWAAVNRGRRDWADELENASPVPLAWRTVWSKWRPYGVVGDRPELAGSVDGVDIGTFAGAPVAASQCDDFFDKEDDYDVELGDTEALERVWRLSDGRELLAPRVVQQFITSEGAVERTAGSALETRRHIRSPDPARGPEWPMRLLPDCGAEAVDGDRWVAYGPRGLYAFDVLRPDELTPGTGPWRRSLVPSFRSTAVWPMPTPVSGQRDALTAWFATAFGDQALRRLPVAALPAALTEPKAGALLSEVGFPELDGSAPAFLTTVAVDEAGLTPVERSETTEPAFLLGHWLAEPVILEGRSGRVLLASVAGTELLGSSLSQFMTLVGLYRLLPLSDFPRGSAEKADAHWSVKAWAKEIDPQAAASSNWQAALGGYLDDPDSL